MGRLFPLSPRMAAIAGAALMVVTGVISTILQTTAWGQSQAVGERGIAVMIGLVAVGFCGWMQVKSAERRLTPGPPPLWQSKLQAVGSVGIVLWIGQRWLGSSWGGDRLIGQVGMGLVLLGLAAWVGGVVARALGEDEGTTES